MPSICQRGPFAQMKHCMCMFAAINISELCVCMNANDKCTQTFSVLHMGDPEI